MIQDIVDFSSMQHDRIRRLCDEVDTAGRSGKQRLFNQLAELVSRHEFSDRKVIYPSVVDHTTGGAADAVACMVEAGNILRELSGLQRVAADDVTFDARFANLHRVLLNHMAHEERAEFPLLRLYVPAQRLHAMANEAHDVQTMRRRGSGRSGTSPAASRGAR
ncbi:hemerythrin domain-containing protein [Paractinoplanes hotanensis]|uniref:Hemerythrin domain-containing protein n=1 Tax=Paractinoplanes hotanensis TaxID=2906497 RepID=A0ABT0Y717_9ACTN|nr:hemerythrin domain-containing protein [Actinoplanes hotanensis]MCM4081272.1 hemerythrin domain-containing protein [Actinoplanes hotanensis]